MFGPEKRSCKVPISYNLSQLFRMLCLQACVFKKCKECKLSLKTHGIQWYEIWLKFVQVNPLAKKLLRRLWDAGSLMNDHLKCKKWPFAGLWLTPIPKVHTEIRCYARRIQVKLYGFRCATKRKEISCIIVDWVSWLSRSKWGISTNLNGLLPRVTIHLSYGFIVKQIQWIGSCISLKFVQ